MLTNSVLPSTRLIGESNITGNQKIKSSRMTTINKHELPPALHVLRLYFSVERIKTESKR